MPPKANGCAKSGLAAMLPREWKAGRKERRACRAIGKKSDGTVRAAAAGLSMIEENRGLAALRNAADTLEGGLARRGADGEDDPSSPCRNLPRTGATAGASQALSDATKRIVLDNRRRLGGWHLTARLAQTPPEGDWRVWLLMGGRGSGKTRAGAEWVQDIALKQPGIRIALVAETLGDAREVMIDGVSGICRIAGRGRPEFEASRRRLASGNTRRRPGTCCNSACASARIRACW
jgi:hypothetical protein